MPHGVPARLNKKGVEAAESILNISDNEIPKVIDQKFQEGALRENNTQTISKKDLTTENPSSFNLGTDVTISASANQVKDIGNRNAKEYLRPLIEFNETGTKQPFYTKRDSIVASNLQPLDTQVLNVSGNKYELLIQAPVDAIDYKWGIRMNASLNDVRLRVFRGVDATGILIYESHTYDDWQNGNGFNWVAGDNEIMLTSELDIRGGDVEFILVEWLGAQTFSIKGFDFGPPNGFIPYIQTYYFPEINKIIIDEEWLEVQYKNADFNTENVRKYGVDTSAGSIIATVSQNTQSFHIFDAERNFSIQNCLVDFGGGLTATLNVLGDNVLFYYNGVNWMYYNYRNNQAGIV